VRQKFELTHNMQSFSLKAKSSFALNFGCNFGTVVVYAQTATLHTN